jgi:hypothetical protein
MEESERTSEEKQNKDGDGAGVSVSHEFYLIYRKYV